MPKLIMILFFLPFLSLASNFELAEKFITLTDATKVKGATAKDIESVLNLLSDEMRYQHSNYGADLTKAQFVEGLVNYMGVADAMESKIIDKISGSNAIAVSFISTTVINGKTEVDEKPLMRVFEFNQDKITLVKEYW